MSVNYSTSELLYIQHITALLKNILFLLIKRPPQLYRILQYNTVPLLKNIGILRTIENSIGNCSLSEVLPEPDPSDVPDLSVIVLDHSGNIE